MSRWYWAVPLAIAVMVVVAWRFFASRERGERQNARPHADDPQARARVDSNHEPSIPEITSQSEEGFHDLVFAIVADETASDGTRALLARGRAAGRTVEFQVALPARWKSGTIPDIEIETYTSKIALKSTGVQSDAFLQALDSTYETSLRPRSMIKQAECAAIALEGNPGRLEEGPTKVKIFFESEDEDFYAEAFLNIDVAAGRLELREKDPDYRAPLVRRLSAELTH